MFPTFTSPAWLWLLAAIPLVWFWPNRLGDLRQGAIRSLLLGLLVIGLAGPTVPNQDRTEHHLFVVDGTLSAGDDQVTEAMQALASVQRRLESERTVLLSMSNGEGRANPARFRFDEVKRVDSDRSPLGDALIVAASSIPDGSRGAVTLISDGDATSRDWGEAVQSLVAREIPIHTVTLDRRGDRDLRPVGVSFEEPIRIGSTARGSVDVIGSATATVRISIAPRDGEPIVLTQIEEVPVSGRTRIPFTFEPEEAGFLPVVVEVEATSGEDIDRSNQQWRTEIAVQDPLRVLYLGERVTGGRDRLEELLGAGFDFEENTSNSGANALDLDRFDMVMLDDRPADSVPEPIQEAVADAVRDRGLGVVMAGGGGSFGPGGYHESPLAGVLPVEFVQKEEKKDPSTALAVIIDTSGSMSGNRMILAKEVTRLAIRRLLPHDKVGIVEFYGTKHWAAPMQSAANAIEIQRALNRLDAGGGTILLPAIEEAYYGLRNMQTRYKHVLVLTDAGVETGPYESLLRRMARDGICVSTVLVGPARHGEFLVQLADWGNGRYYNASDRFNLPEIMLKQPSTARLPAYRPGSHPLEPRGGEGWWGDVEPRSIPSVSGYVESRARPGAEVVLRTREEGHPVLASWRAGLGRSTTFLTEPTGPGTDRWQAWDDYGAFLARVFARTSNDGIGPYHFRLEEDGRRLQVIAERRQSNASLPRGDWWGEGEEPRALSFNERAPGYFVAELERDQGEAVRIVAGTVAGDRGDVRLVSPANVERAPETQVDPQSALDMSALALATGGNEVPLAALSAFEPTTGGGAAPRSILELYPYCFLLSLILFLLEIFYRRSRGQTVWKAMA